MLVLSPKDIKYCEWFYESDRSEETYPGISYQGFLLTRIASFTYKQYEQALAICRECLQTDHLISFLIKEKDKITVWSEVPQVNVIVEERPNCHVSGFDYFITTTRITKYHIAS